MQWLHVVLFERKVFAKCWSHLGIFSSDTFAMLLHRTMSGIPDDVKQKLQLVLTCNGLTSQIAMELQCKRFEQDGLLPRINDPKVQKAMKEQAEKTGQDAIAALQDPEAWFT